MLNSCFLERDPNQKFIASLEGLVLESIVSTRRNRPRPRTFAENSQVLKDNFKLCINSISQQIMNFLIVKVLSAISTPYSPKAVKNLDSVN
jgi:hypothetical protein